jgi:hypothetical protein
MRNIISKISILILGSLNILAISSAYADTYHIVFKNQGLPDNPTVIFDVGSPQIKTPNTTVDCGNTKLLKVGDSLRCSVISTDDFFKWGSFDILFTYHYKRFSCGYLDYIVQPEHPNNRAKIFFIQIGQTVSGVIPNTYTTKCHSQAVSSSK